jgi:hypothetical protein
VVNSLKVQEMAIIGRSIGAMETMSGGWKNTAEYTLNFQVADAFHRKGGSIQPETLGALTRGVHAQRCRKAG